MTLSATTTHFRDGMAWSSYRVSSFNGKRPRCFRLHTNIFMVTFFTITLDIQLCSKIKVHFMSINFQANGFSIKDDQIVWADAIIMVYSITDRKSFEKLREVADYIISKKTDSKTVLALVANKSDLVHMSCVTNLEATQFCAEYNCLFFETSASENYNSVTNAYMSVCKQVKINYKKREKISKFMQNPAIKAKLQIRNPIRGLEMKWRSRAPTMWPKHKNEILQKRSIHRAWCCGML